MVAGMSGQYVVDLLVLMQPRYLLLLLLAFAFSVSLFLYILVILFPHLTKLRTQIYHNESPLIYNLD